MSHIAEKGCAGFHGIKPPLCENPSASSITDKPKACDILTKPPNCMGLHYALPRQNAFIIHDKDTSHEHRRT